MQLVHVPERTTVTQPCISASWTSSHQCVRNRGRHQSLSRRTSCSTSNNNNNDTNSHSEVMLMAMVVTMTTMAMWNISWWWWERTETSDASLPVCTNTSSCWEQHDKQNLFLFLIVRRKEYEKELDRYWHISKERGKRQEIVPCK